MILCEEIRTKNYKRLEFGSSISSLAICRALPHNDENTEKQTQFFSLAGNEFYLHQIEDFFPSKYSDLVEYLLRPRGEKQ